MTGQVEVRPQAQAPLSIRIKDLLPKALVAMVAILYALAIIFNAEGCP